MEIGAIFVNKLLEKMITSQMHFVSPTIGQKFQFCLGHTVSKTNVVQYQILI